MTMKLTARPVTEVAMEEFEDGQPDGRVRSSCLIGEFKLSTGRSGMFAYRLETRRGYRGQGLATKIMEEVKQRAQQCGLPLFVMPMAYADEPMDDTALAEWYGRLGFTEQPDGLWSFNL